MCIIIAKSAQSKHPDEETLRRCWTKNPDGAGIAFSDVTGGVTIIKGLMTIEALLEAMKKVLAVETSTYVVHFRIGTRGPNDESNTHPFWCVEDKIAMVHNGVLQYSSTLDAADPRSDTNAFTEDILKKLPEDWYKQSAFIHLIEDYLGGGNKFAVIDKDSITLLNCRLWNKDDETGLWFSNTGWKKPVESAFPPYTGSKDYNYYNKGIKHEKKSRKQRSDLMICHKRLNSMARGGMICDAERLEITSGLKENLVGPEEVEIFLDMFVSERAAVPGSELKDILISFSHKDLVGAIAEYADLHGGHIVSNPVYDLENSKCFLGKPIIMKVLDAYYGNTWDRPATSIDRVGICSAIDRVGLSYTTIYGNTSYVNWDVIDLIKETKIFNEPSVEDVKGLIGTSGMIKTSAYHGIELTILSVDEINKRVSVKSSYGSPYDISIPLIKSIFSYSGLTDAQTVS